MQPHFLSDPTFTKASSSNSRRILCRDLSIAIMTQFAAVSLRSLKKKKEKKLTGGTCEDKTETNERQT